MLYCTAVASKANNTTHLVVTCKVAGPLFSTANSVAISSVRIKALTLGAVGQYSRAAVTAVPVTATVVVLPHSVKTTHTHTHTLESLKPNADVR